MTVRPKATTSRCNFRSRSLVIGIVKRLSLTLAGDDGTIALGLRFRRSLALLAFALSIFALAFSILPFAVFAFAFALAFGRIARHLNPESAASVLIPIEFHRLLARLLVLVLDERDTPGI